MRNLLIALLLGAGVGCQHLGVVSEICSGAVARDRLGGESALHVRALLVREGVTQRHEAFVEISDEGITVVGLTPLGTQAYSLSLDEDGLKLDTGVGRHLGLDPRVAFDAIARAFLVPQGRARQEVLLATSGERLVPEADSGGWRYLDGAAQLRAVVRPDGDAVHVVSNACAYDARLVRLAPR